MRLVPISASRIQAITAHTLRGAVACALSALLATVVWSTSAAAQAIDSVDAVFSVRYNSKETEGENLLKIQRDGDQYVIDFELDHWMIASKQIAKFQSNGCQVTPESYTDSNKRPFKSAKTQQLTFNWNKEVAILEEDGKEKQFKLQGAHSAYDPLSFFFEIRCGLMAGERHFSYPVIRKGRMRTQDFQVVDNQIVNTPLGDFKALVVERVRDNSKRKTRLYVAPELDYLLVKIEHQEGAMLNIIATLKEMEYQLVELEQSS